MTRSSKTHAKTKFLLTSALFALFVAAPFAPAFAEDPAAQAEEAAADAVNSGDAVKTEEVKMPAQEPEKEETKEPEKEAAKETPKEEAKEPAKETAKKEEPKKEDNQRAAKEAESMKTATVQDPEKMKAYEKAAEKARAALKDIGGDIKEENAAKHFSMMYQNYNLIGTVKVVQEDVGNAINQCGVSNPDLKDKLMDRHEKWNNSVTPVVQEAQANVDNMIIAQDYTEAAKIKKAFKALDEARAATNASVDKRPVSTKEACKDLLEKMDDTQNNLITLLRQTLVSFGKLNPQAAPLSEDEARKKAAAEKEKL